MTAVELPSNVVEVAAKEADRPDGLSDEEAMDIARAEQAAYRAGADRLRERDPTGCVAMGRVAEDSPPMSCFRSPGGR